MATTTTFTNPTYSGEASARFITAALLSGDTIANGGVTEIPNIAFKHVIQRAATDDNFIAAGSCDFTDSGTLTIDEKILTPVESQINAEFCSKTWVQSWEAASMGYSVLGRNLPPTFEEFIIGHFVAKTAAATETRIWQGTVATAGSFDGYTTICAANPTDLAGGAVVTGTTVTSANVIEEIKKVVDVIPIQLLNAPDLRIYVSNHIFQSYTHALGGFAAGFGGYENKGHNQSLGQSLLYDGIQIFRAPGLPTNDMLATTVSNLFFGFSVTSDFNEVSLLDMKNITGSQNYRLIMRWKAAAQIGFLGEVVYYS